MSNCCHNSLLIEGGVNDLCEVVRHVHGDYQPLSFAAVAPEPESGGGGGEAILDWNEWRIVNWGSKWDIDEKEVEHVELVVLPGKLEFIFSTEGSPALPISQKLAERFTHLTFDHIFSDEDQGRAGHVRWERGAAVQHQDCAGGSPEFDMLARGYRLWEEGMTLIGWDEDVPLNAGLSLTEVGRETDLSPFVFSIKTQGLKRSEKVEAVCREIKQCPILGKAVANKVITLASRMGFPLRLWKESGWKADSDPRLWGIRAESETTQESAPKGLRICLKNEKTQKKGGPKLVCEKNPSGHSMATGQGNRPFQGEIKILSHGFEVICPNGWAVRGLLKGGKRGYVVVLFDGVAQNWIEEEPSCAEWAYDEENNTIYKSGEAWCVDGNLWDPREKTAAVSLWYPNGQIMLKARFFSNNNIQRDGQEAVEYYDKNGSKIILPEKQDPRQTSALLGLSK